MRLITLIRKKYRLLCLLTSVYLRSITQLAIRLIAARVFLSSGLTKWDGFLKPSTANYDIFLYEFFCPDPVRPGALLLCDPNTLEYAEGSLTVTIVEFFALFAAIAEVVLPVMLIVGFFSRFTALGLLLMTLFIQLAVFPSWSHWWNPAVWWAIALLAIIVHGPGRFSLDRILKLDGRRR